METMVDLRKGGGAVGALVRSAREDAGFTQQQLANKLGTTQSAVSRWEKGRDEPRLATLGAILAACGLEAAIVVQPDSVDRAQIRQQLAMSPDDRLASVINLSRTLATAKRLD